MVALTVDDNNEIKYFTLEEIAKHDGVEESTVWIIIKDNVYDVTPYLDEHPGGGELITEWAGKDGTKEFDNFGHSTDAKKDLKQFKIGEVIEDQRKKKSKKTEKKPAEKLKPTPKIKDSLRSGTNDGDNETKYFTLEEIAKHDGVQESTVWIIIKDNVYDVTQYLDEHPGGGELITEWAGKDGTKEFDNFGHSTDAKKDLKQFKIGEVTEEQRKKKTKKAEKNQVQKLKTIKIKNSPEAYATRTCISIVTCGILG